MTYNLASIFGPPEGIPEHVNHKGYILCRPCSKGMHVDHTEPCQCDLEEES